MSHPENAYSFNEHSLRCCSTQESCTAVVDLLNVARAWRLHEAAPLIAAMQNAEGFAELKRAGNYRDKLLVLIASGLNRPKVYANATDKLTWSGSAAYGLTVAHALGGFVVSWPCHCNVWIDTISATRIADGTIVLCRNVGSESHLRTHWQSATRSAKRNQGRPASVLRIDAQNNSGGEVPQVHFVDGSALNIDGAWKHAARALNGQERTWLSAVGWVVPE